MENSLYSTYEIPVNLLILLGKLAAAAPEKGKIVPDVKIRKGDGAQGTLRQLLPHGGLIQKGNAAARLGQGGEGSEAAGLHAACKILDGQVFSFQIVLQDMAGARALFAHKQALCK